MGALKYARSEDIYRKFLWQWRGFIARLIASPGGLAEWVTVVYYILTNNGAVDPERLGAEVYEQFGPEAQQAVVTAGQRLRQEGREEGREAGREEGREEGRAEGISRAIVSVLEGRGMIVSAEVRSRVESCVELDTLERWLQKAIVATSVVEIFED